MAVGGVGDDAAPGRAVQKALLHQERFVHVFDGIDGFADGGGNGVEADGTAAEFIDDDLQDPAVRPVEAARIDFQPVQGIVGQGRRNRRGFGDLGEVADALQETVGNTRCPRERRAISRAPSSSMAMSRISAVRLMMRTRSSGL